MIKSIVSFRVTLLAVGCALCSACQSLSAASPRDPPGASPDTAAPPGAAVAPAVGRVDAPAAARPVPAPGPGQVYFPGASRTHDEILDHLVHAEARSFRPVGSTSTVFYTRLVGKGDAAFKAASKDRPLGPAAEVAAYRLGRCLGLSAIAPAASRSVSVAQLESLLIEEARGTWPQIRERLIIEADGTVQGAMIHWIQDLSDVGLDSAHGFSRASEWLRLDTPLPEAERPLAASLSTLLGFDYLIGNFDRWSGGNARGSADGRRLYLRDHDLAFPAAMRRKLHRRLWDSFRQVERFSARFYARVKALSPECLERELSHDAGFAPGRSLRDIHLDPVFDRRQAVVSHIEALIETRGRGAVLVFD